MKTIVGIIMLITPFLIALLGIYFMIKDGTWELLAIFGIILGVPIWFLIAISLLESSQPQE
tara:strand:+ start:710 stop:892 length:183 start_codon:yes stop_codon:yes gene_type:complete